MDLLWKKENTSAGALYVDLFKQTERDYPGEYKEMMSKSDGIPTPTKDNFISKELREKGNVAFKSKRWDTAMTFYNFSLCFAEIHGENVGLAYSNRSACFFHLKMHQKCIIDIDLAIKANFPKRLMSKLENRRAECLNLMPQDVKEKSPQLDFEEDKNFPGLAEILQLKSNKSFGRHYIAKTDIDVGKIVLVEEPFITTQFLERKAPRCYTCGTFGANLIACEKCTEALFCSPKCMSEGFHEINCGIKETREEYMIEYSIKSLWALSVLKAVEAFSDVSSLIEFVEKVVDAKKKVKVVPNSTIDLKSTYSVFLQLNIVKTDIYKGDVFIYIGYELYDYLMRIPTIKQQFTTERHKRFLMHLTLMHYRLVTSNVFSDNAAKAIYPLLNHFNHSCAPNVLKYAYGNKMVVITSRPIKKGDQLFMTYGKFDQNKSERHVFIYQHFGFKCNCEKCESDGEPQDAQRLHQIEADSDYQFVKNNSIDDVFGRIPEYCAFRKKCFDVLTKYGHGPWTKQLDLVTVKLQKLLKVTQIMHYLLGYNKT